MVEKQNGINVLILVPVTAPIIYNFDTKAKQARKSLSLVAEIFLNV